MRPVSFVSVLGIGLLVRCVELFCSCWFVARYFEFIWSGTPWLVGGMGLVFGAFCGVFGPLFGRFSGF